MIARCDFLTLQQEQADFTFDPACDAAALKAVDRFNLHGYGEAHDQASSVEIRLRSEISSSQRIDVAPTKQHYVITPRLVRLAVTRITVGNFAYSDVY